MKAIEMRKFALCLLAAFVLTSCSDFFKKKDKDEDQSEVKKAKKPLKDDDEDEDASTGKDKKANPDDEEDDSKTVNRRKSSDDGDAGDSKTSNYATGWSTSERNAFMKTCVNGAKESMGETQAENYCSCMQQKIEQIYPNAADADNMSKTKMTELAKDCLNQ